jgi:hypothetical protein
MMDQLVQKTGEVAVMMEVKGMMEVVDIPCEGASWGKGEAADYRVANGRLGNRLRGRRIRIGRYKVQD